MQIHLQNFRKLFDAAFDDIEKISISKEHQEQIFDILTSLDTAVVGTLKDIDKKHEESMQELKNECKRLEEDSSEYQSKYEDLKRHTETKVIYIPRPLDNVNVKIDYKMMLQKENADRRALTKEAEEIEKKKENLVDLRGLRKITF